jgi:uncharacterized membrane protein YkoI
MVRVEHGPRHLTGLPRSTTMSTHPTSRRIRAVALLGGGLAAGVIGATALGANAANTSTAPAGGTTSAPAPGTAARPAGTGNGEIAVTGTKAATLKAAALKQVPGGTVGSVTTETDAPTGSTAAYEVHVTKADGTHVNVLFDKNLAYVSTETAGGGGRHGGPGGPGGHGGGNGETPVTGANATTLKNAALAKVPGATVDEVSTDSGDAAYEVHLTKSDGTEVTVKFDKNLAYVSTETGRGK